MSSSPSRPSPSSPQPRGKGLFMLSLGILAMVPVGVSYWAIATLIQLPTLPRCLYARAAQPADQIYCAEQLASSHETEDLRRAMLLANYVPSDHPLRDESDRLIQVWSTEILRRAEMLFQEGQLQSAVDLALEVPSNLPTAAIAQEQVEQWETLWSEAEELYRQGETYIDDEMWWQVLEVGRRLGQLENRYWATTRYQDLMRSLQAAREEARERSTASRLLNRNPETVEEFIAQWELQQAEADVARLQEAEQLAQTGNVENLRQAVTTAQQVLYGTPHYDQAQGAIAQWRQRIELIEDRPYLDRARQLASAGNLQAAINEASNIGWGRALYDEARVNIDDWRDRLYQQQIQQQNADLERITGISADPGSGVTPPTPLRPQPAPSPRIERLPNPAVVPVSDDPGAASPAMP